MSDLISRQAAIEAVNELTYPSDLMDVKRVLANMPSAEPIKHGRWKGAGMGDYMCSWCTTIVSGNLYHYCPNCGAIMDGIEE